MHVVPDYSGGGHRFFFGAQTNTSFESAGTVLSNVEKLQSNKICRGEDKMESVR